MEPLEIAMLSSEYFPTWLSTIFVACYMVLSSDKVPTSSGGVVVHREPRPGLAQERPMKNKKERGKNPELQYVSFVVS